MSESVVVAEQSPKIEKVEEYRIPLSLIDISPEDQHRLDRDPEMTQWRTANMDKAGQTDSIVVRRDEQTKRFKVVAGFGRYESAKKLGWSHIRAWCYNGDAGDAAIFSLSSNLLREGLNPMEISIGIDKAIKHGKTIEEVMRGLGKFDKAGNPDVTWGKQYLDLLDLEPDIQADLANDMMGIDVAKFLSRQDSAIRRNLYKEMKQEVGAAALPKVKKAKPAQKVETPAPVPATPSTEPIQPVSATNDIGLAPVAEPIVPPPLPPAEAVQEQVAEKPQKMTKAVLERAKPKAGVKNSAKFIGLRSIADFEEHLTSLDVSKIPTDPEEVRKTCIGILNWVRSLRKTPPI